MMILGVVGLTGLISTMWSQPTKSESATTHWRQGTPAIVRNKYFKTTDSVSSAGFPVYEWIHGTDQTFELNVANSTQLGMNQAAYHKAGGVYYARGTYVGERQSNEKWAYRVKAAGKHTIKLALYDQSNQKYGAYRTYHQLKSGRPVMTQVN
ncbi:hypothetical protein [Levilactobacillus bambusae]|nr:hypothetical protein [Levilactobacillus bambusae]